MPNHTRKLNRIQKHKKHHNKSNKHQKVVHVGLVYADWCGHCQHLKPEWAKMKDFIKHNPRMRKQCKIIEIESADPNLNHKMNNINSKLKGESLEVNGYPTIFGINKKNKLRKYVGGHTANDLNAWVQNLVTNKDHNHNENQNESNNHNENAIKL